MYSGNAMTLICRCWKHLGSACASLMVLEIICLVSSVQPSPSPEDRLTPKAADFQSNNVFPEFNSLLWPKAIRQGLKEKRSRKLMKRSSSLVNPQGFTPRAICKTEAAWTKLDKAQDMYHNSVEVLHTFRQNDAIVDQLFYETYCSAESEQQSQSVKSDVFRHALGLTNYQKCLGIDKDSYHGFCVTKSSFTYAKVKNQLGEIGWNVIRIRGGCECALFEKHHSTQDVMHYLSLHV